MSGNALGYFRTDAEAAASLNPINFGYPEGNVLRYGIVPNDSTKRAQNSIAIRALVNSNVTGPTGLIEFPNTTGNDTYYFNDFLPSRDGLIFSGNFVTVDFGGKSYSAADDSTGFFYFIRNGGIENLNINVSYDGSTGTHAGNVITIGQRNNAGNYFHFGDENALSIPMGRVFIRNVRITTTNPTPGHKGNDGVILMFGGLRDVVFENVVINGNDAFSYGILYEFGYYDQAANPDVSAHATNLIFRNVRVSNLATTFGEGAGIALIGAYSAVVENLHVDTAYHGFEWRPGEALNYNVGPYDAAGIKHGVALRNIVGKNITNSGLVLIGAENAVTYLAAPIAALGHPADYLAQINLMMFSVDGFHFPNAAVGINVSGPLSLRNGTIKAFSSSGAVRVAPETGMIDVFNVRIFDGGGSAFEMAVPRVITGSSTTIKGRVAGCKIGGCSGAGFSLGANVDGLIVENNDIGYAPGLGDVATESTMTQAVNCAAGSANVRLINNYATPAGGAAAYNKTSGPNGCTYVSGRGTKTLSGLFNYGGAWVQNNVVFSGSMTPDCTGGAISSGATDFVINANTAGAFTINAPLNPMADQRISVTIQNATAGALGAATWNSVFKMTSWTNPASNRQRTIWFNHDGSVWREVGRTAADVPL